MSFTTSDLGAIQTAYVSLATYDLTAGNIVLEWPTSYANSPNVVAASMRIDTPATIEPPPGEDPIFPKLILPDASQTSVGYNFIVTNIGLGAFSLCDASGDPIVNIPTANELGLGNCFWVQLVDNTTADGTWAVITFGAGTSAANAEALAGKGLVATEAGKLNTNIPITPINTTPWVVQAGDQTTMFVWLGGAGDIILPDITVIPAGYYVSFNNEGSGQLNINPSIFNPSATIDTLRLIPVQPGQSLTVISDGALWWTLGFGQDILLPIVALLKDVSVSDDGNGNITLLLVEARDIIQQYFGTLIVNTTIWFPAISYYWFVYNHTDGDFSLSLSLGAPGAKVGIRSPIVVPPGAQRIVYSDGFELYDASTTGEISFPDGSANNPSINFIDQTNTGFFLNLVNSDYLGVAVGGENVARFASSGLNMGPGNLVVCDNGSNAAPALTFNGNVGSGTRTGLFYSETDPPHPETGVLGVTVNGNTVCSFQDFGQKFYVGNYTQYMDLLQNFQAEVRNTATGLALGFGAPPVAPETYAPYSTLILTGSTVSSTLSLISYQSIAQINFTLVPGGVDEAGAFNIFYGDNVAITIAESGAVNFPNTESEIYRIISSSKERILRGNKSAIINLEPFVITETTTFQLTPNQPSGGGITSVWVTNAIVGASNVTIVADVDPPADLTVYLTVIDEIP